MKNNSESVFWTALSGDSFMYKKSVWNTSLGPLSRLVVSYALISSMSSSDVPLMSRMDWEIRFRFFNDREWLEVFIASKLRIDE